MDARVKGHALIWMAITKASCECGRNFAVDIESMIGMNDNRLKDALLDFHSDHIAAVSQRRESEK